MSGPTVRSALAAVLLVVAAGLTGCRGDDADEGRPAASQAESAPRTGLAPSSAPATVPEMLADLPVPRTEVAGATWRAGLAVAGGLTGDGAASPLVHIYDAEADRWEEAPPLPVPVHHAGMAVLGDRVYVVGGYTNGPGEAWAPLAAVRSLAPGDRAWRDEPPMPGGARGALAVAATGDLLVAAGGETGGTALARTEIYDPARRAWRSGPDLATPREHLALAAAGSRVHAIAGRAAGAGNFTVVESLDPAHDRAWRVEPELNDARGGIAAATVESRVCVAGGEEEAGTIGSVECLDGDRWVQAARLARPRHGLAAMALAGRLHVVSGGEQPGLFVSGVHEALDL